MVCSDLASMYICIDIEICLLPDVTSCSEPTRELLRIYCLVSCLISLKYNTSLPSPSLQFPELRTNIVLDESSCLRSCLAPVQDRRVMFLTKNVVPRILPPCLSHVATADYLTRS